VMSCELCCNRWAREIANGNSEFSVGGSDFWSTLDPHIVFPGHSERSELSWVGAMGERPLDFFSEEVVQLAVELPGLWDGDRDFLSGDIHDDFGYSAHGVCPITLVSP